MEIQKCARCQKRPAVVFITRLEAGKTVNEGLCLLCAKELGIKPINDILKKMGVSDEDIENMSGEMEGLIEAVSEDSDAFKKGIKPGDVLMEVNGEKVETTEEVNAIKEQFNVGDTLEFLIWRDGQAMVFEVELYDTNNVYK